MYFGRKHGGHSVQKEMKTCIRLWSLPVPQLAHVGSPGKPRLQREQWSTGESCPWHTHTEGMAAALFTSLSCSRAVCILLLSRSWRNTSENGLQPLLFPRDGCWTVPGGGRGFGHLAKLHSQTPMGIYPHPLLAERVFSQPNPYTLVTLWPYNNPRKAITTGDTGIIPSRSRILLSLAQHV